MLTLALPWLLLVLPLPIVVMYLLPARRSTQFAVLVPFGDRLDEALRDTSLSNVKSAPRWFGIALTSLVWLLIVLAMAKPQWIEPPVKRELPTRDLLLLVDLSGSMDQKDFTNPAGEPVTRLEAVKLVLSDFLDRRKGDRIGLVVFGDAPFLQIPFTTDLKLVHELLDECQVGMAGPRTAFGDAIGLGIETFSSSEAQTKTIIALTDGNDTKSQVPPEEAARVAASKEIRIHTIAIGDPTTVGEDKLDEQALKDVAKAAGGDFFFAKDRVELEKIYEELDKIETRKVETVSHRPRRDLFFIPLGIALVLSLTRHFAASWLDLRSEAKTEPVAQVDVDPLTGKLRVRT